MSECLNVSVSVSQVVREAWGDEVRAPKISSSFMLFCNLVCIDFRYVSLNVCDISLDFCVFF